MEFETGMENKTTERVQGTEIVQETEQETECATCAPDPVALGEFQRAVRSIAGSRSHAR
jgi:hypothetical protein